MNFDAQRQIAAGLPGATEDIKWGTDLVYSVGAKMFCVLLLDAKRQPRSCSFKVDDGRFLELTVAPYLARAKWVQVKTGHVLGTPALNDLIRRSHALVMARLTQSCNAN